MTTTESPSHFTDLEKMDVKEILTNINSEDKTVPLAVEKEIETIKNLIEQIVVRMKKGGRLFYIGAGTSGRLGILDASECPPTYGVPDTMVIGLIAGGDMAIRKAVENAEDNTELAWKDLMEYNINEKDTVIGIAASGKTPYVLGGVLAAKKGKALTGGISCNKNSELSQAVDFGIELLVGSEFVTGSTRMKSGTAQKLVLNMISTTVMIQLGKVKGNKMIDMQLSNQKLVNRAINMITDEVDVSKKEAAILLQANGSVRKSIDSYLANY
ncbi:MAG: N-acetylmuramic acid 6-phosphate etherase [Cyclobacteriaceae bacterium]|nr:N-acetylmuramic acid 6-phosphate etherase [Cyclobacteriaceae bacterium]